MKPHWSAGKTGMYPIDERARCIHCKDPLRKLHGINQNVEGVTVMGFFLFGTGPYCVHDAVKAWTDPDFFQRSGSSEYSSRRWNLDSILQHPGVADELRKL